MSIGPDIKEVLAEVGVSITILRDGGNVTGEYLILKPNAQVTKPFIREFFLEAALAYDTVLVPGDTLEINTTGSRFILMNKTPELFEDAVFRFAGVLYKTNMVVDILRPIEGARDGFYHATEAWQMIKGSVDILFTSALFGNDFDTDQELGLLGISADEVYVPSSIGVQPLDRIRVTSQENYRIEVVHKRRFDSVDLLEVGEDTRPACSTTTTTSSSTTTSTA